MDELPGEFWKLTSSEGLVTVEHEFSKGASHTRPVNHTHLDYAWVRVEAKSFGGATIPVRHESQPTSTLRKQGEILVQIGLIPDNKTGGPKARAPGARRASSDIRNLSHGMIELRSATIGVEKGLLDSDGRQRHSNQFGKLPQSVNCLCKSLALQRCEILVHAQGRLL